jgi:O-acetyl-ADP-ribose deacetylase
VNAWNRNVIPWWLLLPQGVSGAIKRRAGLTPFRELARRGPMPLGSAVATSAGKLDFKAIIHVAGINLLWTATEKSIRSSVHSAMRLADEQGFASIAFPVIGTGSGRFKRGKALSIMQEALAQLEYEIETRIVVYEP